MEIDVFFFNKKISFSFANGKINTSNKSILKYKKDIDKHVCYCSPRLNFKYQICIVSRSYIENFPNELKNEKNIKDVILCKHCKRKFDIGKPFDLVLQNHIISNKSNIRFILMLK